MTSLGKLVSFSYLSKSRNSDFDEELVCFLYYMTFTYLWARPSWLMILNASKGLFQKVGKSDDVGPLLHKMMITMEAGPQTLVPRLSVQWMEFLTQAWGCLRGPLNGAEPTYLLGGVQGEMDRAPIPVLGLPLWFSDWITSKLRVESLQFCGWVELGQSRTDIYVSTWQQKCDGEFDRAEKKDEDVEMQNHEGHTVKCKRELWLKMGVGNWWTWR